MSPQRDDARPDRSPRRFTAAEVGLFAVLVLAVLHHADHVLRVDHSGWPFKAEFTPFTISLLVYPLVIAVLLIRKSPRLRAGLMAAVYVGTQAAHIFAETPAGQYGVWATNMSSFEDSLGEPNLLDIESPALGLVAASISILLSVAMVISLILLIQEARQRNRTTT